MHNGTCRVGLDPDEIEALSLNEDVAKCSTRDMGWFLIANHTNNNRWGATTVASTLQIAYMAGIECFVTGGMGGVHRRNTTRTSTCVDDVSADLQAIARIPMVVVSAGIKSILDIPNTLERLESLEVPVAAWRSDMFPAFFSPDSGCRAPQRVDSADAVARSFRLFRSQLQMPCGMLIGVPNQNADADGAAVEQAIQQALQEASTHQSGIVGRDVTPYVLSRVADLTGGASLRSNLALVQNNATVGAKIAVALAETKNKSAAMVSSNMLGSSTKKSSNSSDSAAKPRVIVFGGVVLDVVAKPSNGHLALGTSNPATCYETDGGVARNMAEVLGLLGSRPVLCSAVGNDARGAAMVHRLQTECGVVNADATIQVVPDATTATYVAVLDAEGDLHTACADTQVMTCVAPPNPDILSSAEILVMDANPPVDVLLQTAKQAVQQHGVKVFFEPTSVAKAINVSRNDELISLLTFASPNQDELIGMATCQEPESSTDNQAFLEIHAALLLAKMNTDDDAHLIITRGEQGVLLATRQKDATTATFRAFPALEHVTVENATGAGDTLAGAMIHALLCHKSTEEAIRFGMEVASLSLRCSKTTISPLISRTDLV